MTICLSQRTSPLTLRMLHTHDLFWCLQFFLNNSAWSTTARSSSVWVKSFRNTRYNCKVLISLCCHPFLADTMHTTLNYLQLHLVKCPGQILSVLFLGTSISAKPKCMLRCLFFNPCFGVFDSISMIALVFYYLSQPHTASEITVFICTLHCLELEYDLVPWQ